MGRGKRLEEWEHFDCLEEEGRIPGTCYYYARCRHCMHAYESAPESLQMSKPITIHGRKSAMQAHLRKCLYVNGSINSSHLKKAEHEIIDTVGFYAPSGRKRRCQLQEWDHFTRLDDEGYAGSTKFFYAVCNHCKRAYEDQGPNEPERVLPTKVVGRKEAMRTHLAKCIHLDENIQQLWRHESKGVKMKLTHTEEKRPRPNTAEIWKYFTTSKSDESSDQYATCNFCLDAFEAASKEGQEDAQQPELLLGRKSALTTHLRRCIHFQALGLPLPDNLHPPQRRGPATAKGSHEHVAKSTEDTRSKNTRLSDAETEAKDKNEQYEVALVEFTAMHNLPFDWVHDPNSRLLFKSTSMTTYSSDLPPDLATLVPKISAEKYKMQLHQFKQLLNSPGHAAAIQWHLKPIGFSELFDSYATVSIRNQSIECPLDQEDGQVVALPFRLSLRSAFTEIERFLTVVLQHGIEVSTLVVPTLTSASTKSEQTLDHAMRLVSRRWSNTLICKSAVGRFHFLMKSIFKNYSTELQTILTECAAVMHLLRTKNEVQEALGQIQLRHYGERRMIANFAEDFLVQLQSLLTSSPILWWRTCYAGFSSLVNSKKACEDLAAINFVDFDADSVTVFNGTFLNESFWNTLEKLTDLFAPLEELYMLIEAGEATIAHQLYQFGRYFTILSKYKGIEMSPHAAIQVLEDLERIWETCEQPLCVLAYTLHPAMRLQGMTGANSNDTAKKWLDWESLGEVACSYYHLFFNEAPSTLARDILTYGEGSKICFRRDIVLEFATPDGYYSYLHDEGYHELAKFLHRLYSIVPFYASGVQDPRQTGCNMLPQERFLAHSLQHQRQFRIIRQSLSADTLSLTDLPQRSPLQAVDYDKAFIHKLVKEVVAIASEAFAKFDVANFGDIASEKEASETGDTTEWPDDIFADEIPSDEELWRLKSSPIEDYRVSKIRLSDLFTVDMDHEIEMLEPLVPAELQLGSVVV